MIKELSCIGYRGFATKQTLKLAIPDGKRGSGLTVLVGPNSGGKSTLVECFSKLNRDKVSFNEGMRNKLSDDRVEIEVSFGDGIHCLLSSLSPGSSESQWNGETKPNIYYLPSRRVFNPLFGKNFSDRYHFEHYSSESMFRASSSDDFAYRLFDVQSHPDKFNIIFWRILGKKIEWTIDQSVGGQYYVKIRKADLISHNSDGLGEGIVSLLFLADAIFEAKDDEVIVIDEPELSLHPQLQSRLLNELLELSKTNQVVIATHSPYMVSLEAICNKGVLARVHEKNKGSIISSLDDDCVDSIKSFTKNVYNPHTFGLDARSCFFAEDGFIITEGQEDVMLYPEIMKQIGVTGILPFFGFGAGGASNIDKIAHIFNCLGFQRIGAIFDGDKSNEYDDFKRKYESEGYKTWIIPADDIRDKDAINKVAKSGLLDSSHQIKEEHKTAMSQLLSEVISFSKDEI